MKAFNITVQQAVSQFSELELLGAIVGGFTGEITADSEPVIKAGKVIRAVKNDEEWPALITIRTDETPPQDEHFYDTECISVIFPDQDTAYFKNLAAELQDYIDLIEPEKKSAAVLIPQCPQCGRREVLHKYVWPETNVISFICISCKQFNNDSEEKYVLGDQISALKSELEVANSMHIDHDRYKWEQVGFGSVDELIEYYLKLLAHIEELRFALIAINSEAKKQKSKFAQLVTHAAEPALIKTDALSTDSVDNCGGGV